MSIFPNTVLILRGKFQGREAKWQCFVEKHPLSNEQRSQLRVQGLPYLPCMKTVLMNESGFRILTTKENLND